MEKKGVSQKEEKKKGKNHAMKFVLLRTSALTTRTHTVHTQALCLCGVKTSGINDMQCNATGTRFNVTTHLTIKGRVKGNDWKGQF